MKPRVNAKGLVQQFVDFNGHREVLSGDDAEFGTGVIEQNGA
jgi:hypothetical protein